jgi:hypothetical protein
MIELVPIAMLAAVLGWWLWVDYQNRLARKEWRDNPIEVDRDSAALDEHDRRLEEMEQKVRQLEAELATLKRSAA